MQVEKKYIQPQGHAKYQVTKFIKASPELGERLHRLQIDVVTQILKEFNNAPRMMEHTIWSYREDCHEILNSKPGLLGVINLEHTLASITAAPLTMQFTRWRGINPLNFMSATFPDTLSHYDIIKFIGQYTSDKEVLLKCAAAVEKVIVKCPVAPIDELLYLFTKNPHFKGLLKYPRPQCSLFRTHQNFYEQIYQPPPNQEAQEELLAKTYSKHLQIAAVNHSLDVVALKWLIQLEESHWQQPESAEDLVSDFRCKKLDVVLSKDQSAAVIALAHKVHDGTTPPPFTIADAKAKAEKMVAEMQLEDFTELRDIFYEACWHYLDDDVIAEARQKSKEETKSEAVDSYYIHRRRNNPERNDEECHMKRRAFELVFTKGIVPPHSDMAHMAMRQAALCGACWAIQFLLDRGVTPNPPKYRILHCRIDLNDCLSPLELAKSHKFPRAAELIRSAGGLAQSPSLDVE